MIIPLGRSEIRPMDSLAGKRRSGVRAYEKMPWRRSPFVRIQEARPFLQWSAEIRAGRRHSWETFSASSAECDGILGDRTQFRLLCGQVQQSSEMASRFWGLGFLWRGVLGGLWFHVEADKTWFLSRPKIDQWSWRGIGNRSKVNLSNIAYIITWHRNFGFFQTEY